MRAYDESGRIGDEIEKFLGREDIRRTATGTYEGEIGAHKVAYILYDAQQDNAGATLNGKAIQGIFPCSDSKTTVAFLGFGVVEVASSLLGENRTDDSTWREVARSAPDRVPGDMVSGIAC